MRSAAHTMPSDCHPHRWPSALFATGARRFGDPMHVMMRPIMALFDEYLSKENAKHVLRALKENARQGFWNGSLPPIGYRAVAARTARREGQEEAGNRSA